MSDDPRRLRFSPELERAFLEDYWQQSLRHTRFVFVLALGLGIVLGLNKLGAPAEIRDRDWGVRYGLYSPMLLALFCLTFSARFKPFMQAALALAVLTVGLSLWAATAIIPLDAFAKYGYADFLLLLLIAYTLLRLRFYYATFTCWILLACYQWVALNLHHLPSNDLLTQDAFLFVANLAGMIANYSTEVYVRRDFLLTRQIEAERSRSEALLRNILPEPIAERLKREPAVIADTFEEVTVLFADIVDFTPLSARISAAELVTLLNAVFSLFDALADRHGLEKIKTIGDAYMVVGGLPTPRTDHAEAIADMALAMQQEIARLDAGPGGRLQLRIGIHTGPVVAGVIGKRKFIYDLWGDTVNTASRMETQGLAGAIQVTEGTYARLCAGYCFEERGLISVKGKAEMPVYLLTGKKSVGS